jgi:hypothetical protein
MRETMKGGGACLLAVMVMIGCGGSPPPEETTTPARATRRASPTADEPQRNDGVQIEGLMGTISQQQVNQTLQPRTQGFGTCFTQGAGVDFLGGDIRLSFRIHTDGTVAWVYPSSTSIGHRAVERCIADRAHGLQFPRPRGGEAEFTWGFGYDAPSDVRAPLSWDTSRIAGTLATNSANLVSACGGQHGFRVTAYVSPGGTVLATGASASAPEAAAQLDCVTAGVARWTFPDPGSYAAKVSFDL